ncbi:hypothetical protein [Pseudobacteroides cellulosolvens]|nr:hypothetical protein [Pseudobacteroides cellulosolvens]
MKSIIEIREEHLKNVLNYMQEYSTQNHGMISGQQKQLLEDC